MKGAGVRDLHLEKTTMTTNLEPVPLPVHPKLVIFDWDGTVMDSVPRIVSCMQGVARDLGHELPSAPAIHDVIGLSLPIALQQIFGLASNAEVAEYTAAYRSHYLTQDPTPTPLFAGMTALLACLRQHGVALAVATGKARPGLERAWQTTRTGQYFHWSVCAQEAASKPQPEMLHNLLQQSGCAPHEVLMIGDSALDMAMGRAAEVATVGVTWGVHNAARLQAERPTAIAHNPEELTALLVARLKRV